MNPDDLAWSAAYTLRNEGGYVLTSYWDAIGECWTVGAGCTGPDIVKGTVWTEQQAIEQFSARHAIAVAGAAVNLGADYWQALDGTRQAALIDQCFQLGQAGLGGFHLELAAIRIHDWPTAAAQLLNSKYAQQTPDRAGRNHDILVTGQRPLLTF